VTASPPTRPTFIGSLAELVLTLVLLPSLMALGEGWFWFLDLPGNFRMQAVVAAIVLLLVFMGLRQWRHAGVALFLVLLNGWFIGTITLQSRPIEAAAPDADRLRVIQFNIRLHNSEIEALAVTLKESHADIIVLQELVPEASSRLEEALAAEYPHRLMLPLDHAFGMGILSRYPLEEFQRWSPTGIDAVSFRLRVQTPQLGSVHLAAIHPLPPMNGEQAEYRNTEIMGAAEWLAAQEETRILMGDLNLTPYSIWYRRLVATSGMAPVRRLIPFANATWPDFYFIPPLRIPIDHILISDDLAFSSWQASFGHSSDHAMVVADIIKRPAH
jgi:endonuclease/exonuclease/phosphatase (EEP) superfamily protein YafD